MYLPTNHCALPKHHHFAAKKIIWFCVVLLNNCMNMYKNKFDDALTLDWLRDNAINEKDFAVLHIKLLQAQRTAHILLGQNKNLLTADQIQTLKSFSKLMVCKRMRSQLKPEAAYPVLNISTNNPTSQALNKIHT